MDTNQNQHINTFLKGMNTDISDMLIGSDQYRYAENIRIVTNEDSNSGEVHLIEGTANPRCEWVGQKIIAVDYIRDIAVFITVGIELGVPDNWSVYRYLNGQYKLIFGPCTEKIWKDDITSINNIRNSITTVLRYESPKNIKLYIADSTGKHSIMLLNIANDSNNIETNFDKVFAYQRTLLPPAQVSIGSGTGSIPSGKVQYVYRLYSKNGASTPLSILSLTLSLYKNEFSGYEPEKKSGKSVNIYIPKQNDSILDHILIYRISYQVSGLLPKISLVKDEKTVYNTFIDTGTSVEEDVPLSELLSMFTPFIYPKLIESKGDYLFAGNMKYSQDDIDKQFEWFDPISYSSGNYIQTQRGDAPILQYNEETGVPLVMLQPSLDLLKHQSFSTDGSTPLYNSASWNKYTIHYTENGENKQKDCIGFGNYICWNFVYDYLPSLDSRYQGSVNYLKSTFRCGETYRFGIKLYDKYGRSSSVKWICDILIPPGANMDIVEANTEIPSTQPFPVTFQNARTVFRNIGIEFFKTPGSDWKDIAGWEIVRCERTLLDRKALTLGIIGFPVHSYYKSQGDGISEIDTKMICTPGVFSTDLFTIETGGIDDPYIKAETDSDILMFSSPEYCYLSDDIKDILKSESDLYITKVYKTDALSESRLIGRGSTLQPWHQELSFNFKVNYSVDLPADLGFYFYGDTSYENDGNGTIGGNGLILEDGKATTRWFLNYFTPNYESLEKDEILQNTNIGEIAFSESPKPSDFANSETLTYKNSTTSVSTLQFINWSVPLMLYFTGTQESDLKEQLDNYSNKSESFALKRAVGYPIGSGGKTILFKQYTNKVLPNLFHIENNFNNFNKVPSITVVNINKNCNPYNGYNKTAIENSSYISFGDYASGETDSISVFSGDTKNRIFTYNALHNWYDSTFKNCKKMASVYAIPVETDIDIQAQCGVVFGVDGFTDYRIQDIASAFENYTQLKGSYSYNTAYNATPDIVSWTTPGQLEGKLDEFDTRIHYSNVKTNNEDIDSWIQFSAANYIDVDSRYGEITDLKLFKDKLVFWLETATGVLAVNERVVLNDLNDTQVVLGTGGVLERYDYFTTVYGQKKDLHVRAISNNSLYWWDGNNKEILIHQLKYDVSPLSTIKNIKNHINSKNESTVPFMIYDPKYKEVLMNVVDNNVIVYNELIEYFTSIYKFTPLYGALINNDVLVTSEDIVYDYNISTENGSYLFENPAKPKLLYVVNNTPTYTKTYDSQRIGGRFYGGGFDEDLSSLFGDKHKRNNDALEDVIFTYKTPLKQLSTTNGKLMTNLEYDFKLSIPRDGNNVEWGNRLRGKIMLCIIESNNNSLDFSLQYVITKYRISYQ